MKKYAIIVAGGSGLRMGTVLPKQFLLLAGKPILWYTLQTFLKAYKDVQIILVLPEEFYDTGRAILNEVESDLPILTIAGGPSRFHSVKNGLSLITENAVVFVHDAVRCLVTPSLIHLCFDETIRFGSAIPCIDSKDSVRIVSGKGSNAVKRTDVKLVQTPQTFLSKILIKAYDTICTDSFTDDASVVEASGVTVHLVEGEVHNMKITTPADLMLAGYLLDNP